VKLYNTLTRTTEELVPLKDNHVSVYTCGLTVYGQPHIGNWIPYIYWDILVRALRAEGYDVTRVENYTDVGHLVSDDDAGEDKMEKGARREGLTAWDVAEKYIAIAQHEAYDLLKLTRPGKLVRATSCIEEQIAFVVELEKKGYTYVIEDEGVYFDTSKLDDYGKLARLDIDGLQAGARVDIGGKKNPTDFAVWKFSPKDEKRDMEWKSPWGTGFPGWHLECSVIARENLGDQIDIHTGGVDHIPVHHTNEIAQTEAVTGKQFAQIWVHNNHLKVDGGKMSKSLGNVYTLQDILDKGYSLDAYKLFVLSKHYSTEGNFTWENLEAAQNALNNMKESVSLLQQIDDSNNSELIEAKSFKKSIQKIKKHLSNNLQTPLAVSELNDICKKMKSFGKMTTILSEKGADYFTQVSNLLGIDLLPSTNDQKELNTLLSQFEAEYARAKSSHDFTKSDKLKKQIEGLGYKVSVGKDGKVTWFAEMQLNMGGSSRLDATLTEKNK
jgi:cysteinyl-tRNA synthetase